MRAGTYPLERSREAELLFACMRLRPDERGRVRIRRLLDERLDWIALLQLAGAHQVVPLLRHRLGHAAPGDIPPPIVRLLDGIVVEHRARARRGLEELVAVLGALERAGITAVPLKGPVLAWSVFADVGLRTFQDLDFLVRRCERDAALDVLLAEGYDDPVLHTLSPGRVEALKHLYGQFSLYRAGHLPVEPHWAPAPCTMAIELDYDSMIERARPVPLDGHRFSMLSAEDLALALLVHGGKEAWSSLKWLADVDACLTAHAALDWDVVVERARAVGVLRMVLLGLRAVERICGTEMPSAVEPLARADAIAEFLAWDVERRILRAEVTTFPMKELSGFRMRMRERARDRVAYVWRTLVTPQLAHYRMVRLPDALIGLYPPLKVVHDYALLPVWSAIKAAWPAAGSPERGHGTSA